MSTTSKKAPTTQGVEGDITSLKQIKEWVKTDVARAISFLNAIHSDPDLIDHVATFMYGRLQNDLERKRREEAEKAQGKIFE